jgi:hypothetical protein
LSYKAYKDKNGNYEILSQKDEALRGTGNIIGTIIGYTIIAPFWAFFHLSAKKGKLLRTDDNNFIIFVDGRQHNFPIESLKSVVYGYGTLQFKFKKLGKISVLKMNEEDVVRYLAELFILLEDKNIKVSFSGPLDIYEWHKEFMKELKHNKTKKPKISEKPEKESNELDSQDIRYWKNLFDEEIITEEEFTKKKKELLNI